MDDLILPIVDADGRLTDGAAAGVVAIMCYPNDEARQQQAVDYSMLRALAVANVPPPQDTWRRAHYGPSESEFMAQTKRYAGAGVIAGEVLGLIKQFATHRPKDASVHKAVHVLSNRRRKQRGEKTISNVPLTTVTNAWRDFKSVSHLWAAYLAFDQNEALLHNTKLRELLAVSESLREFAELHTAPPKTTKSEPLVKKGELWRAPEELNVGRAETEFPPLSDDDIHLLGAYRAPKRKKK